VAPVHPRAGLSQGRARECGEDRTMLNNKRTALCMNCARGKRRGPSSEKERVPPPTRKVRGDDQKREDTFPSSEKKRRKAPRAVSEKDALARTAGLGKEEGCSSSGRGVTRARKKRDPAQELFRGRDGADYLRKAMVWLNLLKTDSNRRGRRVLAEANVET